MAMNIDEQFVEYIVKSLVNNPDAVSIARRVDDKGVLLELTVDAEDLGRVIGKRGATAQSLRTLLRALGTKNDARYNLKIVDVDKPESERGASITTVADDDATDDVAADEPMDALADAADDETETDPDTTSDAVKRARAELADLDDLDI